MVKALLGGGEGEGDGIHLAMSIVEYISSMCSRLEKGEELIKKENKLYFCTH